MLTIALLGACAGQGPPSLSIAWREGPEYPLGIQESVCGIIDGLFVSAGGFTRHPKDVVEHYPDAFGGAASGFTSIAFAFDPADEAAGWQRIADIPGPPRQGAAMVAVDNALYAIGGFNYDLPNSYRDTYRLTRENGDWTWTDLECPTPWPLTEGSATAIGAKIYLFAPADYYQADGDENADFHADRGRNGDPVGQALLMLDTGGLDAGWQRLADCPGTPRFDAGVAAAGGKLYTLGGIFALAKTDGVHPYTNVVDSWVYDPPTDTWTRLPDMPDGANRRAVTYADRTIILLSGYRYPNTRRLDGSYVGAYTDEEKALDWRQFFEKTVLVFDTKNQSLTSGDPLIERTSWPSATLSGDTIYCLGGEGGRLWHPATFQIGTITELTP